MPKLFKQLPNGKGFPRGLNSLQVTQLTATFNIAVHFCSLLSIIGISESGLVKVVSKMMQDFSLGNYKNPLKALENVVKKSLRS